MASIGGAGLVEAYVLRKLYKEEMRKMEKEELGGSKESEKKEKKTTKKSFFGLNKKVHPNGPQLSDRGTGAPVAGRRARNDSVPAALAHCSVPRCYHRRRFIARSHPSPTCSNKIPLSLVPSQVVHHGPRK